MIFIYSEDFIYLGFYRLNVILIVDCKDMKRPLFKPKSPFKPKFFVFKPKLLTLLISSILSSSAFAGQVYSGVDYQYFRDFAENKGKFTPGAQNIAVVNKKGESIGTMMQNAPMMDFSVVSRNGVAALVGDQYIVSVAHNVGYSDVDFGMEGSNPDQHRFGYNIVKRNNYKNDPTHPYMTDYHNPRLAKFVTEAAPIEMVPKMQGSTYSDLEKYPMRVRIGSGRQVVRDAQDKDTEVSGGYDYRTAGNTFMQGWSNNGEVSLSGDVRYPNQYGVLPISGSFGDSGSPMFIYDKTAGKWLINGVLRSGHPYEGKENTYQIARKDYLDEVIDGDLLNLFEYKAASYDWTADGNGSGKLTKGSRVAANTPLANYSLPARGSDEAFGYGGPNPYMPALHHGKNIYFGNMENGTIALKNNIDQGAGGLTFEGDFVVQPTTDETWKGAGVSVGEGSTVTWKVKNPAGDRLSKIGQGMLLVNGKGENLGDISVGDGVVVLNQQADEQGKKQAFKQLGIVSGRPTVKLESADQVDPNNIYFGFRGGRLDLNGHSLTFNRIQNTDEGAQIVNHNKDTAATITIRGNAQINNEKNINQSKATAFNGWFGETNAALHNGRLNIDYQPTHTDSVFLLSGGTNLNGNVTQTNGTLVFSGRPTPHAYNHLNRPALIGRPQGEVVIDDDWLSRTFKAEKYIINGGSAVVSRNVSAINGDWQLSNNANATLGVTDKQANFICARSDWTGLTKCANQTLSDKVFTSIERSKINGNFTLNDNAKLSVLGLADVTGNVALQGQSQYRLAHNATQTGTLVLNNQTMATIENATLAGDATLSDFTKLNFVNARFEHQIQGSRDTLVSLSDNANWTLPSSTIIGNLTLNNSQITLNPDFATQTNNQTFNQLTVLSDLSGNGTFNYRTYLQENKGDHVAVHGWATGNFVLNVRNTGAEPQTLQQLSLLTLKNTAQTDNVNVALANGTVDVGTYRYELKNDNHDYRLYNPRKEQELADQARLAEEKRKAEEAARLAEEKRKADEAVRLAEEKRKAEELARLAEEKRKAEEAARLAEDKRKADGAARLAEEKRKADEAARLAEEKRKADEAVRLAEEKRKAEEAARLAEEKRKAEELVRLAEEKRKAEELVRLAEEKRKAEEAARLAEEKRKADGAARLAEEKRKADEAARLAEEKRKAEELARLAEEKRKADEAARLSEEKRKAEEAARLAEEKRKADEAARLAEEKRKADELARLAEEKRKADEAARLAEEAQIAEAKAKAEELRLAEEQQKEELRLAEEKRKAEELVRLAEEKRKADEAAARLIKEQALLTIQHQSLQPKQKDLISRYANSALSELSSSLNGSLLIQNELNKHMFEQNSSYIWHNITEFSGRYHSDDFRDYQQKTHLNQLGLQHIQDNYRAGLLLSYARTKNEFDDDIHGKSRLNMVSAFTQSQFENGINMTLDASRGIHFSKIFGKTQDADIRRHITSLGVGFDYQFDLDKLSIQPNFSTHHYQFSGTSYVYDQVQVHTPKNQFNVYQAGATLKYTFTPRDNLTITPQVSIHYLDVSNAKFTTQVNQAMLNQSLDSRWQKEIGLQASFGGWSFSAYAAQTQGKQQEKQHQAGLKVGVYW